MIIGYLSVPVRFHEVDDPVDDHVDNRGDHIG